MLMKSLLKRWPPKMSFFFFFFFFFFWTFHYSGSKIQLKFQCVRVFEEKSAIKVTKAVDRRYRRILLPQQGTLQSQRILLTDCVGVTKCGLIELHYWTYSYLQNINFHVNQLFITLKMLNYFKIFLFISHCIRKSFSNIKADGREFDLSL